MKKNWPQAFALTLKHEGGYVHHPLDPGGRTNLGVTQRAWEAYLGRSVTESEMKALTPEIVKPFYKKMYWDKIRGDDLPSGVDFAAYDFAVNSGVNKASKTLQEIAGVIQDGIIGPKSLAAIQAVPPDEMVDALCLVRLQFLKRLPRWDTFGKGWGTRVAAVEKQASEMAKTA